MQHPQRAGDPLALTVNYCAPVAEGVFDLDVRLVKANRSSQHWSVEMTQGGGEVTTLATAVFAERRPSWSHQPAQFPGAVPFEQLRPYPKLAMTWPNQYDFRFAEGEPKFARWRRCKGAVEPLFEAVGLPTACRASSTRCR